MTCGEWIKKIRVGLFGLTQEKFSELLGIERGLLAKWESGKILPSAATLTLFECITSSPSEMIVILNNRGRLDMNGRPKRPEGQKFR